MKISIVSVYLCFGYCSCQRICYCSTRNSSSFFFSNGHPPVVGDRARAWRYKRTNRQFLWWWCTEASSAAKTCSAFPSMLEKFQEFFFYLSVQKLRSIYTQKRRSKKRRRDFSYGFDSMMTAGWENQNSSSSLRIVRSVFFFLFIIYRGKRNGANVTSSSRIAYYIKRSLRVCLTAICMQNRWREPTAAILNPPRTENFLFISSAAKQLDEIFEGGTS